MNTPRAVEAEAVRLARTTEDGIWAATTVEPFATHVALPLAAWDAAVAENARMREALAELEREAAIAYEAFKPGDDGLDRVPTGLMLNLFTPILRARSALSPAVAENGNSSAAPEVGGASGDSQCK